MIIKRLTEEDAKFIYETTPVKKLDLDIILLITKLQEFDFKGDDFVIVQWSNAHHNINPKFKTLGYSLMSEETAMNLFLYSDSEEGKEWKIRANTYYRAENLDELIYLLSRTRNIW
ncbi:hypothetical protein HYX16_04315 [Candidatus Woesearchaeota archaeon]|nr:hypothetical protein [Candidatus Woesearchaeota archaeon]